MKDAIPFLKWQEEPFADIDGSCQIDGSVVYSENTKIPPACYEPFKLDALVVNLILKGKYTCEIDARKYTLEAPCLFVELPGKTRCFLTRTGNACQRTLLASPSFMDDVFVGDSRRETLIQEFSENPVIPLDKQEKDTYSAYFDLIKDEIRGKNPKQKETVKHLFRALISRYQGTRIPFSPYKRMKRFGDFMNLVRMHHKTSREVSFYANKMGLSSRYLSKIVAIESRKPASKWINDITISEIKTSLRSSGKPLRELAEEFNFKNGDSFTKYFTRLVKMSPSAYRKKYGI